jgi:hypothetical protein
MKDGRVRKTLYSLIGAAVLTFVFTVVTLTENHPQLIPVGILFVLTIYSVVRFLQMKKKVMQEFMRKASQEERL